MRKKYTRRDFIKTSTIGIASVGAVGVMGKVISVSSDTDMPNPYPVMPDKGANPASPESEPLFFNSHQYGMVAVLAALIVPTDEDPGAAEAGVADYIDRLVAESEKKQKSYVKGLDWIDDVSQEQYKKDFLSLNVREQIELMIAIDEAETRAYRHSYGLKEKIEYKISEVWNDLFGVGKTHRFFNTLRKDVFYGYYSNPISWKVVGYFGPPQPLGYPDNFDPPSSDNYIDTRRPLNDNTCQNCHSDLTKIEDHEENTGCMECHEPHFPLLGKSSIND